MFPHQLVGVAIRRVRREKEQHQLSVQRFNKGLGLLGAMCGPAIDDQEDLALRADQKSLQKFELWLGCARHVTTSDIEDCMYLPSQIRSATLVTHPHSRRPIL